MAFDQEHANVLRELAEAKQLIAELQRDKERVPRFVSAATACCKADARTREFRGKRCTEASKGNDRDDPGQAPCFMATDDTESMCERCQERMLNSHSYNQALKSRGLAKRRMRTAIAALRGTK